MLPENVPAKQTSHFVLPDEFEYNPAGQAVHRVKPVVFPKYPGWQEEQEVELGMLEYIPARQYVQLTLVPSW